MPAGLEDGVSYVGGEAFERLHTKSGVTMAVKAGTPDGDREITRNVCYDATTHTTLAGKSGTESEVARFIIKPAGKHHGTEAFGLAYGEHLFPGKRIYATVGEE